MLLIIATTSFSQQTTPEPTLTKQDYLKKSKLQNTTGWVILSGGVTAGIIATITVLAGGGDYGSLLVLTAGGVLAIASVPFFYASVRNKEKAMSLSFKNETAPQILKSSFVYKSVPSLTLKINL